MKSFNLRLETFIDHLKKYYFNKTSYSNILFCTITNDEFFPGTAVMLYSMKKHLKSFDSNHIRIFFDNNISPLSNDNQALLKSLSSNIELIEIKDKIYRNAICKYEKHRLAYLTIEAFNQNDFSKIIFFDGDMLTLKDFSHSINFSFPIFGSKDGKFKNGKGPRFKWRSINTGFFGFDSKKIPSSTYPDLKEMVRKRNDPNSELLDQKMINNYFSKNKIPQLLIHHYNNFRDYGASGNGSEKFLKKKLNKIKIIHFSGYEIRPKPWEISSVNQKKLNTHIAYKLWLNYANDLINKFPPFNRILEK